MVRVLEDQDALTIDGNPVGEPIPVAPVVEKEIETTLNSQTVGEDEVEMAVFISFTVIVPVAFTLPHPPVKGML